MAASIFCLMSPIQRPSTLNTQTVDLPQRLPWGGQAFLHPEDAPSFPKGEEWDLFSPPFYRFLFQYPGSGILLPPINKSPNHEFSLVYY